MYEPDDEQRDAPSRGSCGVTITSIRTAASAAPSQVRMIEGRMIKETPPHGGVGPEMLSLGW